VRGNCPELRKHLGNMTLTDPIADMLTRIRNANLVGHEEVSMPHSKLKQAVADVLKREGFLAEVNKVEPQKENPFPALVLKLRYAEGSVPAIRGLQRVSTPGQRIYVTSRKIPLVLQGLGVAILSTPAGILTDTEARKKGTGGEVMCTVW